MEVHHRVLWLAGWGPMTPDLWCPLGGQRGHDNRGLYDPNHSQTGPETGTLTGPAADRALACVGTFYWCSSLIPHAQLSLFHPFEIHFAPKKIPRARPRISLPFLPPQFQFLSKSICKRTPPRISLTDHSLWWLPSPQSPPHCHFLQIPYPLAYSGGGIIFANPLINPRSSASPTPCLVAYQEDLSSQTPPHNLPSDSQIPSHTGGSFPPPAPPIPNFHRRDINSSGRWRPVFFLPNLFRTHP